MANWTTSDIPGQSGRLAVITGATGGLGFETALALAAPGAQHLAIATRLWDVSETLTNVRWPITQAERVS